MLNRPPKVGQVVNLVHPFVYGKQRLTRALAVKTTIHSQTNDGTPYFAVLTLPLDERGFPFKLGTATFYNHELAKEN